MHLTFEEALAARGLVQKGQLKLDDSLALIGKYVADPAWRETLLLAVGVWGLVREEPRKAGEVVRAILKMDCDGDDACTNVLLAGACLEDVGEMGLSRAVANEVKDALLAACAQPITSCPRFNATPVSFWDAWVGCRMIWTPSSPFRQGQFMYRDRKEGDD